MTPILSYLVNRRLQCWPLYKKKKEKAFFVEELMALTVNLNMSCMVFLWKFLIDFFLGEGHSTVCLFKKTERWHFEGCTTHNRIFFSKKVKDFFSHSQRWYNATIILYSTQPSTWNSKSYARSTNWRSI